jgi:hypothetical protein
MTQNESLLRCTILGVLALSGVAFATSAVAMHRPETGALS